MPTSVDASDPEVLTYFRTLVRRKALIIGLGILGLLGALMYGLTATPEYDATAQILVQPQQGSIALTGPQATITPVDVSTQLQLLQSSTVQNVVKAALKFTPKFSAAQIGTTDVIAIVGTSSNSTQAALVANTYATQFVSYQRKVAIQNLTNAELQVNQQITTISTQLAGLSANSPGATALANQEAVLKEQLAQLQIDGSSTSGGVTVSSMANVPKGPSSPKKTEDVLIGLGGGLVVGALLAFLLEFLEDAVRSRDDLERMLPGVPILGMIPMIGTWKKRTEALTVSLVDPNSTITETYRSLRSSISFASYDEAIQAILVTSPTATDGKTSTVSNLGVVFANSGQSVLLLSTDLRRPRLGKFFDLDESTGLTSVVIGDASLDEAIQAVEAVPGLFVLGSGPIPPNPSELLSSKRMADIMADLRTRFDIILIDSPPLLPVTDPVILGRLADLSLVIVAAGQTKKAHLARAIEQLSQANVTRIALLLNEVQRQGSDSSYSYSYSYSYKPQSVA